MASPPADEQRSTPAGQLLRPVNFHAEVFHEGEVAVQRRVGTYESAQGMGLHMVQPRISPSGAHLLKSVPHLFLASVEPAPRADGTPIVWASALFGPPGFARVRRHLQQVEVCSHPTAGDPLTQNLAVGSPVAMIAIEFQERSRYRINGKVAELASVGLPQGQSACLVVEVLEAFGNCPKYIAARTSAVACSGKEEKVFEDFSGLATPLQPTSHAGGRLTRAEATMVQEADTFFLATVHPARGADLSHRGGRPGFVRVAEDGASIFWADYPGNGMFQSLGNVQATGVAGAVFVDWATGSTLQVAGRAAIEWRDGPAADDLDGCARVVRLEVERTVFLPRRVPVEYCLPRGAASPFNPSLSGGAATASAAPRSSGGGAAEAAPAVVRVAGVAEEAMGVKSFFLEFVTGPQELMRRVLSHRPGEHATFRLHVDGQTFTRTWTISSAPWLLCSSDGGQAAGLFAITVKREPRGLGSRFLHDCVQVGTELELLSVDGGSAMCCFPTWDTVAAPAALHSPLRAPGPEALAQLLGGLGSRQILLAAGGIGITPLMSNLRAFGHLRHVVPPDSNLPRLALLQATRSLEQTPFLAELLELRKAGVLADFVLALTGGGAPAAGASALDGLARVHVGRPTEEVLRELLGQGREPSVFLCGPGGFMDAIRRILGDLGVEPQRVHSELFSF